jgi:Reverse transcriptase (RNA-dependent DNA polymerase)
MKIPKGFTINGGTRTTHVIKLLKNLYGQKQAGRVWNKHLHEIFIELGWVQSQIDECLYHKRDILFLAYVDDVIIVSPHNQHIDEELDLLKKMFNISDEGTLNDYVRVNIERAPDGTVHMTQPQLSQSVLTELNFNNDTKEATTPVLSSTILRDGKGNEPHKADWNYRRIIGKLNFIASPCRPELSCAVQQAARFSQDPRTNHTEAVKRIARYLKGTVNKGIIFRPTDHAFKVYADADFGGLWDKETANDSPVTAKSRTGFVITYAACPIFWASQLQTICIVDH